jgi:uncharacterized cupredoxin-like copper-binding protein
MRRLAGSWFAIVAMWAAAGCGDRRAETPEGSQTGFSMPAVRDTVAVDWVRTDEAGEVTIELTAGLGSANSGWNLAGFAHGGATVIVPTGARVTLVFSNQDANSVHSVGLVELPEGVWSAVPEATQVFSGAATANPTSMTEATAPGESETIFFSAEATGDYALACLVPGHAVAGMWIGFRVEDGATPAVMTTGVEA